MDGILKPLFDVSGFKNTTDGILRGTKDVLALNVVDSQKIHLGAGLQKKLNRNGLYITFSEVRAKEIVEDLKYFFHDNVMYYPSKDILFYNADVRSLRINKERFKVVESLINDENTTVVLSIEAMFDRFINKDSFKNSVIKIKVGDEIAQDKLVNQLVFLGYENVNIIEGYGQFSVRGGILDIFPINFDIPVRLEFWGDEIDSIRTVDLLSQRSVDKISEIKIIPTRELVYTEKELKNAITNIETELDKTLKSYKKKGLNEEFENLSFTFNEVLEKLKHSKTFNGIEKYAHYFNGDNFSILDYLKKDTLIFVDEPNRVSSQGDIVINEFDESIKNRILKGHTLPSGVDMVFSYKEILRQLDKFQKVLMTSMAQTIKDFTTKSVNSFDVKTVTITKNIDDLADEIKFYVKNNYRILFLAGGLTRGQRILRLLTENNISCNLEENLEDVELQSGIVTITKGNLNRGFEYPEIKFVVITDRELYTKETKKKKKKIKGQKIDSFAKLKIGDFIVHENHGIGIYCGIEKVISNGVSRDYLKLEYKDGGAIYVSTNQMNMLQKYLGGGEGAKVKLTALGGKDWAKAKTRAKTQVAILAKDLVQLYAKRHAKKGFLYSEDSVWQREFEDLFPYEETDDQKNAISDVKTDMQSQKVMDRLICGDVGYGKTEIAIRASFKAVQDGKQVAYLVPTTILAQQHYNTYVERMKDFPVNIEMLSRFRTAKQQKEIIKKIETGEIDIIIGTHRILSKDMKFKDLGLVIIDEEQRFGVAQKEKLKSIRENVDVLALSATPIPRTLHMSLTGIRDISTLEEPPEERLPVQTYVMQYSNEFVRDAINREIGRGGQVFYLHNRVKNIEETADKIQRLVPDCNVAYGHGQMSERQLEKIMLDFIEGNIDVLVCTTIIETGLDIQNANTIIIQDSDYMGLSQLYQLRGRVGRSSKTAYAYLMYKRDKVLTEIAEKRLQTIREFTAFGSGFKIAMKDLEIRGAGDLLGAEQHGYMDSVGYDMYCKLLDQEIRRLSGEEIAEEFETSIEINIDAYIPNYFIKNEEEKLDIYKKISFITTQEGYYEIQEEIEDRFGNLPQSVNDLLNVALLKGIANKKGITSITQKNEQIFINFKNDANVDPQNITKLVTESRGKFTFKAFPEPYLTYRFKLGDEGIEVENLQKIIYDL